MTALDLFTALTEPLAENVGRVFPGYHGCILHTRIAIEVAGYFGIRAEAFPCQLFAYNAAFKRNLDAGRELDVKTWQKEDGSWSVGIGLDEPSRPDHWNGHLIAIASGAFADYAVGQAERIDRGIILGPAIVGPYRGADRFSAENDTGTVIEYRRIATEEYLSAPDWRDPKRRKAICGPLIRRMKTLV